MFKQADLRHDILQFQNPPVDVVTCMLALHYFWANSTHIHNILTTMSESLKIGGFLLMVIVDSTKLRKYTKYLVDRNSNNLIVLDLQKRMELSNTPISSTTSFAPTTLLSY
jgi:hypothetical protein